MITKMVLGTVSLVLMIGAGIAMADTNSHTRVAATAGAEQTIRGEVGKRHVDIGGKQKLDFDASVEKGRRPGDLPKELKLEHETEAEANAKIHHGVALITVVNGGVNVGAVSAGTGAEVLVGPAGAGASQFLSVNGKAKGLAFGLQGSGSATGGLRIGSSEAGAASSFRLLIEPAGWNAGLKVGWNGGLTPPGLTVSQSAGLGVGLGLGR